MLYEIAWFLFGAAVMATLLLSYEHDKRKEKDDLPHCNDKLIRKDEYDTAIPLGFVNVYYCTACEKFYALIETYKEIEKGEDENVV